MTTTLFQEESILGSNASLTYGPQLQWVKQLIEIMKVICTTQTCREQAKSPQIGHAAKLTGHFVPKLSRPLDTSASSNVDPKLSRSLLERNRSNSQGASDSSYLAPAPLVTLATFSICLRLPTLGFPWCLFKGPSKRDVYEIHIFEYGTRSIILNINIMQRVSLFHMYSVKTSAFFFSS